MTIYTTLESPLGDLLLTGEKTTGDVTLTSVSVPGQKSVQPDWRHDPAAFAEVESQLKAYFGGERRDFELDIDAGGTDFQRRVWEALKTIPYGTTTTYGELAASVGAPRDRVRAVAAAIGANPLLIVRPCHRVIGVNGSLTGYAGGVERKERLLVLEGALQPQLG